MLLTWVSALSKHSKTFVFASQSATTKVSEIITSKSCKSSNEFDEPSECTKKRRTFKLIQVQLIHRHGDRSPITPMKDEKYWLGTLPSQTILDKMAEGTTVKRHDGVAKGSNHAANGRGPFGKLSQLGLLQMVEVGSRIRAELHLDDEEDEDEVHYDEDGHIHLQKGKIFTRKEPIHPSKIRVRSTDFSRTLQSVQALIVGLFPDGLPDGTEIEIDARHTDSMIPDPQPRASKEQVEMEKLLNKRQHLLDKEAEMKDLAHKVSKELKSFIAADASSVSFGIGEESNTKQEERPLSWSQLSEIMTCLKVRGLLPKSISDEDYQTTTSHSAWKWFENLRHPKLAFLAMKPFMNVIMNTMHQGREQSASTNKSVSTNNDESATFYIYSGHDSSLIGLMCAFRLQQPSEWPEYGSYLKIELFEAVPNDTETEAEYFVRFSLNGNVLKSNWGIGEGEYLEMQEMIPLHHLDASIKREHGE